MTPNDIMSFDIIRYTHTYTLGKNPFPLRAVSYSQQPVQVLGQMESFSVLLFPLNLHRNGPILSKRYY